MKDLLALPRTPLAATPTPLQPAFRLGEALGVELWFKRDDLTGLGLGGNKVRALEYLMADALAQNCDCLVTGAGPQSNWAMLAALAARRCGLDPYLVCYGSPVAPSGNLLLDELAGADVRFTGDPDRASVDGGIDTLAGELRRSGRRPCVLPRGGATVLGAAGYVRASLELADQLLEAGLAPARLWLATGSCGTQAGLVAGARWLRAPYRVVGVTVSRPVEECVARVTAFACGVGQFHGVARLDELRCGAAADPGLSTQIAFRHGSAPLAHIDPFGPLNSVGAPPVTRNTTGPSSCPASAASARLAIALAPNTGSRKIPSARATSRAACSPAGDGTP